MKRMMLRLALLMLAALPLVALQAQTEPSSVTIHVVQRGENLFRIAQAYETTWQVLAQLNNLADPSSLEVGQRLLVPASGAEIVLPQTAHTVQPGESLASIGAFFGVSSAEIMTANALPNDTIYVGQLLQIPQASSATEVPAVAAAPAEAAPPAGVMHIVAAGETLFRIGQIYGVGVSAIAEQNSISDPQLIYPGQRLLIPGVQPPQLASGLPAPLTAFDVTPVVLPEGTTGRFHFALSAPVGFSGSFLGQTLNFIDDGAGGVQALIGVPVGTAPGIYPADITLTDSAGGLNAVSANVQVVSGGYRTSADIQVTGDSSVLLDPAVEETELATLRGFMSTFSAERYFNGAFGLPAAATITSAFGETRTYNSGQITRVHTGTDFGGAPGTPILAPASGRVVFSGSLAIRGQATIIDHGWGVYTGYWHQSQQYVAAGEFVQTGQVIGAIGATGRVSGPHLHWELWVNGVPVDPMQWTVQPFSP